MPSRVFSPKRPPFLAQQISFPSDRSTARIRKHELSAPGLKNELSEADNFWVSRPIGSVTPGVTFLFHSRIQFPRSSHSPRVHGV